MGDGGRVLTTDFAPEMLEAARRNGERRGLSNVEYQVMDAERMQLDDDSVDGVVCRWGYMLMADPAAALAETRRVLRDGGTLGFAVWQTPDRNPWAAIPGMVLVQRGHMPPPEPGAPGIFAMGDRGRVEELVTGAGFGEPRIEELTFEWRYGASDVWDTLNRLAGPLAAVIKELSEDEQQATRAAIEDALEQFRDGERRARAGGLLGRGDGLTCARSGSPSAGLHRPGRAGSSPTSASTRTSPRCSAPRSSASRTGSPSATAWARGGRCGSGRTAPFEETVTQFEPDELIEYRITKGTPLRDHVGVMRFTPAAGRRHPPRLPDPDRVARARAWRRSSRRPSAAQPHAGPGQGRRAALSDVRAPAEPDPPDHRSAARAAALAGGSGLARRS